MRRRVKRLFSCAGEGVEAMVIVNSPGCIDYTFFYVTGYQHGLFEGAVAVLYPDGRREVVVPRLEASAAGPEVHVFANEEEKRQLLSPLLDVHTIGFHGQACPYTQFRTLQSLFPRATLTDVSSAVREARMVKDEEEIDALRRSGALAAEVARALPEMAEDADTEADIRAAVNYRLDRAGASPAFDTIVACGSHAALPHYTTGTAPRRRPILVDFGARYRRYCSDVTRTLAGPGEEQQRAHEAVREVQFLALDMIEPGVAAREIHERVNASLVRRGFSPLPHATGHSLGLEVHDGFSLSESSQVVLEPGMVMTVEPGVYISGRFGIRIEDDVLVTSRGCEVLTREKKKI